MLIQTVWLIVLIISIPDEELFSETAVGCTASYFVNIIWCSCWFWTPPPYFEAEYCLFCGRRRVAVARYRMICLVLEHSALKLSNTVEKWHCVPISFYESHALKIPTAPFDFKNLTFVLVFLEMYTSFTTRMLKSVIVTHMAAIVWDEHVTCLAIHSSSIIACLGWGCFHCLLCRDWTQCIWRLFAGHNFNSIRTCLATLF